MLIGESHNIKTISKRNQIMNKSSLMLPFESGLI